MSDMRPSKSWQCDDKQPSSTYKEQLRQRYDYLFVSRTKLRMPRKKRRWATHYMIWVRWLLPKQDSATRQLPGARVACLHNKKRVGLWQKIVKERAYDLLLPWLQLIRCTKKKVEDAMDTKHRDNSMTSAMKWRATRESLRQYDRCSQEFLMLRQCITIWFTMTFDLLASRQPREFNGTLICRENQETLERVSYGYIVYNRWLSLIYDMRLLLVYNTVSINYRSVMGVRQA